LLHEKGKNPKALRDKPNLPYHLHEFVSAFNILNNSRQYVLNALPLPLLEIVVYAKVFTIPCSLQIFIRIIQAMDKSYLAANLKKQKAKSKRR
jgi:hypothetical protein